VHLGHDNETVLSNHGDLVWNEVCKRINAIIACPNLYDLTPVELIQQGLCDPVKVFIKNEPHSTKKIVQGKLRIISSVSLVDQIVTRVLCQNQNAREIMSWKTCSSAPGMGLHDDGLRVIWQTAKLFSEKGTVCETDVSGWDWSVQQWELDLDADCRTELAGQPFGGLYHHLVRAHAYMVGNSVFVSSNGDMFEQTLSGGQLSGCYNTSSTNSRIRVMATLAARLIAGVEIDAPMLGVKAMGDDSFEIWFAELEEGLRKCGHTVKMCVQRPTLEGFEFCSQVFVEEGVAFPVNFSKTLFRFLSHNPADPDYAAYKVQLDWYMRHLPVDLKTKVSRLTSARVDRAQRLAAGCKAI